MATGGWNLLRSGAFLPPACSLPLSSPSPGDLPPACAAILTWGVKLLQRCWVLLGAAALTLVALVFWLDLSHP